MYKIFTLAVAVSLMPVHQKITGVDFLKNNPIETPHYIFSSKNKNAQNPFEQEIKTTEAWSQNWVATA